MPLIAMEETVIGERSRIGKRNGQGLRRALAKSLLSKYQACGRHRGSRSSGHDPGYAANAEVVDV